MQKHCIFDAISIFDERFNGSFFGWKLKQKQSQAETGQGNGFSLISLVVSMVAYSTPPSENKRNENEC